MEINLTAKETLQTVFGYDSFRPFQETIIEGCIAGEDHIVIMPTGGGKSLCYQIPALERAGCAIIISPLISLMQDQVLSLKQLGVAASLWNSTLSYDDVQDLKQQITNKPVINCSEIIWSIGGLSAATINSILQLFILIFNTIFIIRYFNGIKN